MNWDLTTRRWHKAIVADAERTLDRSLKDYEMEFITSRGGYIALEMIHDHVKAASSRELEAYLASGTETINAVSAGDQRTPPGPWR